MNFNGVGFVCALKYLFATVFFAGPLIVSYQMEVEIIPNPEVLASARAFHNAAKSIEASDFTNAATPKVVNSAFALELYLKSFNAKIIYENPKKGISGNTIYETVINRANTKGHVLTDLFAELNPEVSVLINSEYPEQDESFMDALAEFNSIFIEWRYIFEGNARAVTSTKLYRLLNTLEHVASILEKRS